MLKRTLSLVAIILLIALAFPIKNLKGLTVVKNGKSSGEFISGDDASFSDLINLDGVSYKLDRDYNYENLLIKLNATLIHIYDDGEILNLYYYTDKIPQKEKVFNKYINLHIAVQSDGVTVGAPLIYYGY